MAYSMAILPLLLFMKFLHDWLPIDTKPKHYMKYHTHTFPSCPHTDKTWSHFLHWPTHTQWRASLFQEFTMFFTKTPLDPVFEDVLIAGLQHWLSNTQSLTTLYSLKYQPLLCHQSAVGWDHLLLGQFVLESRDLHSHYLKFKQEGTKANLCQTWLLSIINILWKQVYLNQEALNPNKHNGDKSTREAA